MTRSRLAWLTLTATFALSGCGQDGLALDDTEIRFYVHREAGADSFEIAIGVRPAGSPCTLLDHGRIVASLDDTTVEARAMELDGEPCPLGDAYVASLPNSDGELSISISFRDVFAEDSDVTDLVGSSAMFVLTPPVPDPPRSAEIVLDANGRLPVRNAEGISTVTSGDCLTRDATGLWNVDDDFAGIALPAGALSPFLDDPDVPCIIAVDVALQMPYVSGQRQAFVLQELVSATSLRTTP